MGKKRVYIKTSKGYLCVAYFKGIVLSGHCKHEAELPELRRQLRAEIRECWEKRPATVTL